MPQGSVSVPLWCGVTQSSVSVSLWCGVTHGSVSVSVVVWSYTGFRKCYNVVWSDTGLCKCSTVVWSDTGLCKCSTVVWRDTGSVLGFIIFTMYTAPINRILQRNGVSYHTYVDDIQIYVSFYPNTESDKERFMGRLVTLIREIRHWILLHRLKLNDGKTELNTFHLQTRQH